MNNKGTKIKHCLGKVTKVAGYALSMGGSIVATWSCLPLCQGEGFPGKNGGVRYDSAHPQNVSCDSDYKIAKISMVVATAGLIAVAAGNCLIRWGNQQMRA